MKVTCVGYKQSQEHKQKISMVLKGKSKSEEFKKKMKKAMTFWKGKQHSKEIREKISKAVKGFKHTSETKLKIGISSKGRLHTEETKEKIRKLAIGIHKSEKTKIKQSKARKQYLISNPKEILRLIEMRKNQIFPLKDTSIEIKIQNFLKEMQVDFLTHQYIKDIEHGYQVDILIPSLNLVIECDGDYWHKYPLGNAIDHVRTRELLEKGFRVLRLWEKEIRELSLDNFKSKLEEVRNNG